MGFFMVSLIVKSNLFFYSTEMKQKKSKHGFVLRQVVLKNVSGQMVSASVSINEMFSVFLGEPFP